MRAANLDLDRRAAVFRIAMTLELRLQQWVELAERHVDRYADRELAVVHRRHQFERGRERAVRLALLRRDAGVGLHADGERDIARVDLRLRGGGADRAQLQPQAGQAGLVAAERDRAAHLGPLLADG